MKKLVEFLRNYANGDDAEVEYFFTWPKFIMFLAIVGIIFYIVIKWR
jgi:hypothetical protein